MNKDGYVIVTKEQIEYEMGENSPYKGKYITYGVDDEGNYIRISIKDSLEEDRITGVEIAVFVGGAFVGYLISSVVDGVVIAVTGHSGGEWVSYAIEKVLNKPYVESVILDKNAVCAAYPPYGAGVKPSYCY